jgi:2'-5' RNA ligase
MRLFIGVALPDSARKEAAAACERLKQRTRRAAPRAQIRWVEPANLHVTLWFLGETKEAAADAVRSALDSGFAVAPFDLQLARFGAFPETGSPRVLWMDVARGREQLVSLYLAIRDRLATLGFEPERRGFSPHLTLARVKDISRSDAPVVRKVLGSASPSLSTFTADAVTLFRSYTSPHGARYESLLRVPLKE